MNNTTSYLTQIDYIRILLEESRHGEALNYLKIISDDLERNCVIQANKFDGQELELPKSFIKTKPEKWLFLNETWMKLIDIKDGFISLEISDGITIKNKFKIVNNLQHA